MKDIIDEVKEDLHQEAFSTLVVKYGQYVLIFGAIIILTTSIFMYLNHRNITIQEKLSKIYYNFQSKPGSTEIPAELIKSKNNIYLDLASLDVAMALRDKKDYQAALNTLHQLINTTKHLEIKNLAGIHAIFIALKNNLVTENQKLFDTIKTNVKINAPFGTILHWSVAELELAQNHPEIAAKLLEKIKDTTHGVKLLYDITQNSIISK